MSIDRNVRTETLNIDDRIGSIEAEMASMKTEMASLSADVRMLTMNMMTVLNELKTIRDGVDVDRSYENVLEDPYQNTNFVLDQWVKRFKNNDISNANLDDLSVQLNDTDLEERVTILEFQMTTVTDELIILTVTVADTEEDVDNVEGQVTVILADQVIQDERLLELETDKEGLEGSVNNLQLSVLNLEVNNAGFNATIEELSTGLMDVNATVGRHDAELDELQENLEDLTSMVDGIDVRLSEFELNGTVASHAYLTAYTSIPVGSAVIFQEDYVNIGSGYDVTAGDFTVQTGKAGLYYFYVHFTHSTGQLGDFRLLVNNTETCRSLGDDDSGSDSSSSSCSCVANLGEGIICQANVGFTASNNSLAEVKNLHKPKKFIHRNNTLHYNSTIDNFQVPLFM